MADPWLKVVSNRSRDFSVTQSSFPGHYRLVDERRPYSHWALALIAVGPMEFIERSYRNAEAGHLG